MCTGTRAACWSTTGAPICAGSCVFTPRAVAETCNGLDDDCDNLVDENPSAICDDGLDCSTDVCFGTGGCYSSVPGNCQEIRRPTGESYIDTNGAWVSRRDNPRLTGRAQLQVGPYNTVTMTKTMSPVGDVLFTNVPNVVEPGNTTSGILAGWVQSDNPQSTVATYGGFRAPRINLPVNGSSVPLQLTRIPGLSGASWTSLDLVTMRLDPDVLVLPVRLTVFTYGTATPALTAYYAGLGQSVIDGANVASTASTIVGSTTTASSQSLPTMLTPDDIWTQCGIQFRLEDTRVIQNAALGMSVAGQCGCGTEWNRIPVLEDNGVRSPLGQYIDTNSVGGAGINMIDIFLGGDINYTGFNCSDTRAFGCGPFSCAFNDTIGTTPGLTRLQGAVVANQSTWAGDMAHEFGHVLGLGHAYETTASGVGSVGVACVPDEWAPAYNAPNLMAGRSTSGPLVASQCMRARCVAAYYLARFGRITNARRDAICAG